MNPDRRVAGSTAVLTGAAAGYLVGSVSFSRLVGERAAPGQDLNVTLIDVAETGTTVEFHGITPTSVKEHAGNRAMTLSIAMEAAKAAVPTLAARMLMPGTPEPPAAASWRRDRPHPPDVERVARRLRDVAHDRRVPGPGPGRARDHHGGAQLGGSWSATTGD